MNKIKRLHPLVLLALAPCGALQADIAFEEVSQAAGIVEIGSSWGTYWSDFNGDRLPDFWATNHGREPGLYLNQGDGTFVNVVQSVLSPEVWARYAALDVHGASWGDFNNDGLQDLFENAAGGGRDDPNNLYLNVGGTVFAEVAAALGVDIPDARPRTPLWFDWNRDGQLDLLISSTGVGSQPAILMQQGDDGFSDVTSAAGIIDGSFVEFSMVSDLNGDGDTELATAPINATLHVYVAGAGPLQEQAASLGISAFGSVSDAASGDFDGDLQTELFMVQGELINGFDQPDDNTLEARLNAQGTEVGLQFSGAGALNFTLYPNFSTDPSEIHIGAGDVQPADTAFTLSPTDPEAQGIAPHDPGVSVGLYVGYDAQTQRWTAVFSHFGNEARNLVVTSAEPVSGVTAIGFDAAAVPENNLLLDRQAGIYTDIAALAGTRFPDSGRDVAVGDFDNDADLDVYVVATGPVTNMPNRLYANNGDGTFVVVPDAGGAGGTLAGRGDAVSVADYDLDGWLDLLVTNGKSKAPFESDGPYQLFRNLGGANHWLQIDLEGVNVNRDAVGARVEVTAGGVTQVREQNNGMHFRSQDHSRLHFGLGAMDAVEQIVVRWPNGSTQTVGAVPADHLLDIVESLPASVLGEPKTVPGASGGVFVWKDSFDGDYHLRVRGNGVSSNYTIRMIADAPPLNVSAIGLERPDALVTSAFGFEWSGQVTHAEDGIDLALPPATCAMLAVTRDDRSNPRQLQIGADRRSIAPAGWILPIAQLAAQPVFNAGTDLGFFAGQTAGTLQADWSAAGAHSASLTLMGSEAFTAAAPQGLEAGDSFTLNGNVVSVTSTLVAEADGVNASLPAGATVAIDYLQDGLFQRRRVALAADGVEQPNAYRLPAADPAGRPQFAATGEGAVSLWREQDGQSWTLRVDGGDTGASASGRFRSGQPLRIAAQGGLDKNDRITLRERRRLLSFAVTAQPGEVVQVTLLARPQASLSLDLDRRRGSAQQLAIGAQRWPVEQFPVELN